MLSLVASVCKSHIQDPGSRIQDSQEEKTSKSVSEICYSFLLDSKEEERKETGEEEEQVRKK